MKSIQPKVVYSPEYDFHFYGLERLHPFDGHKFSRAWKEIVQTFDNEKEWHLSPLGPVSTEDLCRVHTAFYLSQLESPTYTAQALELPILIPLTLIDPHLLEKRVLYPMRLATQGTILAAEAALEGQVAVNLGGGYHHARRSEGEGFCIYSDIAIAITKLRSVGKIKQDDKVLIVDLDAHQSNGLERIFYDDRTIYILDMYNQEIYPQDHWAQQRIDCDIPLYGGMEDKEYHTLLAENLSQIIEGLKKEGQPKLAFYVAGTDVYYQDQLGRLKISKDGVFKRDTFVFDMLTEAGIPWIMTLGGGYSKESYMLVADSVRYILSTYSKSSKSLIVDTPVYQKYKAPLKEETMSDNSSKGGKDENKMPIGKKIDTTLDTADHAVEALKHSIEAAKGAVKLARGSSKKIGKKLG